MEQWINPVTLGSLVGLITALGGAIGFLIKHFTSVPIDRRAAEVAAATAITSANKTSVETAAMVIGELRKENERLISEISVARSVRSAWEDWYNDLVKRWDEVRMALIPPDAPETEDKQ